MRKEPGIPKACEGVGSEIELEMIHLRTASQLECNVGGYSGEMKVQVTTNG